MQQSSEHSVEDILETIKRVIARDNRESAQAERARRETDGVIGREDRPAFRLVPAPVAEEAVEDTQVLDLGETSLPVFDADEPLELGVEQAEAETEYDLEAALIVEDDILDLVEEPAPAVVEAIPEAEAEALPEPLAVAEPELETPADSPTDSDEAPAESVAEQPLTSEDTAQSVRQSLAALALLAGQGEDGDGPDRMIAEMAREMLRPMLAQWLDENLPDLVERLVKAEIGRLTGLSR